MFFKILCITLGMWFSCILCWSHSNFLATTVIDIIKVNVNEAEGGLLWLHHSVSMSSNVE